MRIKLIIIKCGYWTIQERFLGLWFDLSYHTTFEEAEKHYKWLKENA